MTTDTPRKKSDGNARAKMFFFIQHYFDTNSFIISSAPNSNKIRVLGPIYSTATLRDYQHKKKPVGYTPIASSLTSFVRNVLREEMPVDLAENLDYVRYIVEVIVDDDDESFPRWIRFKRRR